MKNLIYFIFFTPSSKILFIKELIDINFRAANVFKDWNVLSFIILSGKFFVFFSISTLFCSIKLVWVL